MHAHSSKSNVGQFATEARTPAPPANSTTDGSVAEINFFIVLDYLSRAAPGDASSMSRCCPTLSLRGVGGGLWECVCVTSRSAAWRYLERRPGYWVPVTLLERGDHNKSTITECEFSSSCQRVLGKFISEYHSIAANSQHARQLLLIA